MRRSAAALAAAALLAAAGCKPSSLTPGWIEERTDYGQSVALSGNWEAVTSGGGLLRFQVTSAAVADIYLLGEGPCGRVFTLTDLIQIENGGFSDTREIEDGGFFSISATFTSRAVAEGSYSYNGAAVVDGCPRDGSGTFTAVPVL